MPSSYFDKNEYKFKRFEQSKRKNKKYDAILINKITKHEIRVPFGDSRYQQYKDNTGLKIYSNVDHGSKTRQELYIKRHKNDIKPNHYSAGYFSMFYLW
jgi:hypothetical protein